MSPELLPDGDWSRAVALAGTGRFAGARVLAARLAARTGVWSSAGLCLRASMLRQTSRHRAASAVDGAALAAALAGSATALAWPADPIARAFAVDALVGLAADALGTGRFALARTLLDRAGTVYSRMDAPPGTSPPADLGPAPWWTTDRAALRRAWVTAETAVYTGDTRGSATAADDLAARDPGPARPRYHAKNALIRAAALAASGRPDEAVAAARCGYEVAADHGLRPLEWAGARLVGALVGGPEGRRLGGEADRIASLLAREGAVFGSRGRSHASGLGE
ncbi:hypothetical protein [Tsukamurella soli]|uniref:hypothetical protein n=1 Tax=Tsukamurella soli TaxID=644556 RepID=UPI0031E9F8F8